MENQNLESMRHFDLNTLPDLDVAVLAALELFSDTPPPEIIIPFKHPLVVGSEGAKAVGRIISDDANAVIASEGSFEERLKAAPDIDGAVIVSASGGKHSVRIAEVLEDRDIPTLLLTTNAHAEAKEYIAEGNTVLFPKNREPYTYNTSTYLGMILSKTKEDPERIHRFISEKVNEAIPDNLGDFDAFFFIIPNAFHHLHSMFMAKFDELFGARVSARVFTFEQAKHAKTVVASETECFVSFGEKNDTFGTDETRFSVPLPHDLGYAAMMMIGYYVVGRIQRQHSPYFKNSIVAYAKEASRLFGQTITPIVE